MPPTTGGSTSGSSTSERTHALAREVVRASTIAIGTPKSTQSTVLIAEVRRLSQSAVSADSDVISATKSAPVDPGHDRDEREQQEAPPRGPPGRRSSREPDLPLLRSRVRLPEAGVREDPLAGVAERPAR